MPRLIKGQIASGIQLRLDMSKSSANARIVVFKDLQNSTSPITGELEKFRSFQQLASWEDPAKGITPLSTKTLRKHLDSLYEGGSSGFRKDVGLLLGKGIGQKEDPIAVGESEKARKDRFAADAAMEMTTRYLDLLERLKRLSVSSEVAEAELLRHIRRYGEGGATLRVVK